VLGTLNLHQFAFTDANHNFGEKEHDAQNCSLVMEPRDLVLRPALWVSFFWESWSRRLQVSVTLSVPSTKLRKTPAVQPVRCWSLANEKQKKCVHVSVSDFRVLVSVSVLKLTVSTCSCYKRSKRQKHFSCFFAEHTISCISHTWRETF